MPDELLWDSFFEPEADLALIMPGRVQGDAVEFGCGYGTFTIPAARHTSGTLHAFDIEPEMVAVTAAKARKANLGNVRTVIRDFVAGGTVCQMDRQPM